MSKSSIFARSNEAACEQSIRESSNGGFQQKCTYSWSQFEFLVFQHLLTSLQLIDSLFDIDFWGFLCFKLPNKITLFTITRAWSEILGYPRENSKLGGAQGIYLLFNCMTQRSQDDFRFRVGHFVESSLFLCAEWLFRTTTAGCFSSTECWWLFARNSIKSKKIFIQLSDN